jgi:2-polyprenyl-3-methyl-5-hydroxy-6-metoxy-1,4-benzoquinol methylase
MEKGERSFQVNLLSKFIDCISSQKIHTMVNIPEDKIFHYSGHENLEIDVCRTHFNNWIYKEIFPGLKGDILEVGSGIGTFSQKIIRDVQHSHITLTDISLPYVKKLEERFSKSNDGNNNINNNNNISICKLDLNCKADYEKIGYEKFDSIIAINVLEHVEDDIFALQQLYKMLKSEGILIILVPCHKFLYNVIDTNVGHFRRYTKKDLELKIRKTRFSIERMFYFNMLGIIGWYINGNIAKNPKINSSASKLFDRIVPLLKYMEAMTGKKIGLSIICYLKKHS